MNMIHVTPTTWATESKRIQPGDEVVFEDGIYQPFTVSPAWRGQLKLDKYMRPLEIKRTRFRAEHDWRAVIHAKDAYYGIHVPGNCQAISIEGIGVERAKATGIKISPSYVDVIRCYVHGCGMMGIEAQMVKGVRIVRSLVEFCGTNPWHHHGIYPTGEDIEVIGCIIRHNSGGGIASIPSKGHRYDGNLIVRNGVGVSLNSVGVSPVHITSCTIADNITAAISTQGARDGKVVVDSCITRGYRIYREGSTSPRVDILNPDFGGARFISVEHGDYRHVESDNGWPAGRQWSSKDWWDNDGAPYRRVPTEPMPLSLMPGGVE